MTGYYNVYKEYSNQIIQGYIWSYHYLSEDGKNIKISRVDLNKLKEKDLESGLKWEILDEKKAKLSNIENKEATLIRNKNRNNTGLYHVSKCKSSNKSRGFKYVYSIYKNGERIRLSSIDLNDLEKRVKEQNLYWGVVDEEKADKTLQQNLMDLKNNASKTGYYRVYKDKSNHYSQGYIWIYEYLEGKTKKKIHRVDLNKLKEEVLNRGLEWKIINKEKAKLSDEENLKSLKANKSRVRNNTGFYNVSKSKCKSCSNGFYYVYSYYNEGNRKHLTSVTIKGLEKKVKSKGLIWKVIDEELTKNII